MEPLDQIFPATPFAPLPTPKRRWTSFGLSLVIQVPFLLIATRTLFPVVPEANPDIYSNIRLDVTDTPGLTSPPPALQIKPALQLRHYELPRPKIELPKERSPSQVKPPVPQVKEMVKVVPPPLPEPKHDLLRRDSPTEPKITRAIAATNFVGSSTPPTVNRPALQVQTGGFGDPNGAAQDPNSTKASNMVKVGSFDLPEGPGNGTGGGHGSHGVVASAGFGNSIAPGDGNPNVQRRVQTGNFGSFQPAPPEEHKRPAEVTAKETPVSLLSKPTPDYTTEARTLKIEGDVELEVEFAATGKVHVIRVIQGLGHGLDDAAVRAAEQIRFAPAQRDGQLIDSYGKLRVVFRLS
ncbi:MAG TPA: energy transducer TonB [Edaphobacter sp.]|nr:energy transducer TonB [Edaphobacter sp.]